MKKMVLHSTLILILFLSSGCMATLKQRPIPAGHSADKLKARDFFTAGIFKQQQGRYNEALVDFYQALQYDSTSATIYNSIAENHMKLSHFESAKIYLRKSLRLQPENSEALQLLAECDLRLGQDDQAIAAFKRILNVNPYDSDARQYLILLYEKNGDALGVASVLEARLRLYGKSAGLLKRLSQIYIRQKMYDKALYYLNELQNMDSASADVPFLMGQIKDVQNQPDSAAVYYRKTLRRDPAHKGALDRLTTIYRSRRNWKSIIDLYRPVLEADSTNRAGRVMSAEAYYYLEQYEAARRILRPLVQGADADPALLELMGRIELEAKHPASAASCFRRILRQSHKNRIAWMFLAFSLSDMDSVQQAQEVFEQALKHFPDDATLWAFYGNNLQQQEMYEPAIAAFRKTLELDSTNRTALAGLPVIYESLKMYARCDSVYELAVKRLPDNALILNNFGYSLSERNIRLQEALKMAQKAVSIEPENAAYLDTIGWIYFKLGQLKKAAEYIRKAVDSGEASAVVLEHLGDVYAGLGQMEQAKTFWQKSIDLEPDNQPLIQKLEKIK